MKSAIVDTVGLMRCYQQYKGPIHITESVKREMNGFCAIGKYNNANICEGDQGAPAIYVRDGREYLAGIASFEIPKYTLRGRNNSEYFCGLNNETDSRPFPAKYVRIFHLVNWMLRDHSNPDAGAPIREEVYDCLVTKPADKNSIPFDVSPREINRGHIPKRKRPLPNE